jgi:hypothetical protein
MEDLLATQPHDGPVNVEAATKGAAIMLEALGWDLSSPSTARTPERMALALAEMCTPRDFELTTFPNDGSYRQLVMEREIPFPMVLSAPHEGGWHRVLTMAANAANALEPHVHDDLGVQVLGMLTLNAALAAAAVLDTDGAEHWLGEATKLAARVPDDPGAAWQYFSATNVGVWRIDIGVECGQSGGAVRELANLVDVAKLDVVPGRKAFYFAHVGCGLAHDSKTEREAIRWLSDAETASPQKIRNNMKIRESVIVLLERARTAAVGRELRGMAARMGIPH